MSVVQIKYAELLRLSVEQLFYRNRICRQYRTEPAPDFVLVPTESCLTVMQRMDLVFRNTAANGGFVVLGRVLSRNAAGNEVLRFPAHKDDALSFLMMLKNPDAVNFNDLPLQLPADTVYYFTNEITDAAAPRGSLHITKGAASVDGTNDATKKSSGNYRFHLPLVVLPDTAQVKHALTGQTALPVSLTTQAGQSDLAFNLATLPAGRCRLLINGLTADEFYYLGRHYAEPVFGVIELLLSSALPPNYRIVEPDRSLTPERPLYVIRFGNRTTIWRYTVQVQPSSPLYLEMAALTPAEKTTFINQLNIVSNDTTLNFHRITATDTTFVFESANSVFLQEKYFSSTSATQDRLILTLKKYIGDAAKEAAVKTDLPYPSPSSIAAASPSQLFSDIFLTL